MGILVSSLPEEDESDLGFLYVTTERFLKNEIWKTPIELLREVTPCYDFVSSFNIPRKDWPSP